MSYRLCKKGFTLVELVVVLVIIGIVSAIGIPTASHFIKNAEYRKNEENAKTAYLAAESVLTWYRTSGQWEDFQKQVVANGVPNTTYSEANRIYAVSVNHWDGADSASKAQAMELLEGGVYSGDFFNAEIVIEVDVKSGQVYSAFYGTRCNSLTYNGAADGKPSIACGDSRKPEVRREVLLGYYSVEDVSNVVELKQKRLKVTTINLVNSETLSLNWSSNSKHDNRDVKYDIIFYKEDGTELFSTEVDLFQLWGTLSSGTGDVQKTGMVGLELKVPDAADPDGKEIGKWNFPLTYQQASGSSGRFSLVLDGMMTAELAEAVEANKTSGPTAMTAAQMAGTSITRLGKEILALESPQDIYAEIQVQPAYANMGGVTGADITEYKTSSPVRSNTENTLFAKAEMTGAVGAETLNAEITRYRHLSNIRYYDKAKAAEFTLAARNLDWTSAGVGMYDVSHTVPGASGDLSTVGFSSAVKKSEAGDVLEVLDFPSIPLLSENHKLIGNNGKISNLHLGVSSVADDELVGKLWTGTGASAAEMHYSHYLGLFCEANGSIEGLTLTDPVLRLVGDTAGAGAGSDPAAVPTAVKNFKNLYGIGVLCGRSQGSLKNIAIKTTKQEHQTVLVRLEDRSSEAEAMKPAGIGGLVGVLAKDEDANNNKGSLEELADAAGAAILTELSGLTTEGRVTGYLPNPDAAPDDPTNLPAPDDPTETRAEYYPYGVGGMIGYAWIGKGGAAGNGVQLKDCKNYGDVNGNLFTGGIAGSLRGDYDHNDTNAMNVVSIQNGYNEGLVLCLVNHKADPANYKEEENKLEGRYFGGITGYSRQARISDCVNASKYGKKFVDTEKDKLLQGHYVGGIVGYGADSQLSGCSTRKESYVLGSYYVGGIAGGLSNDLEQAITKNTAGIQVTTNGGYVIGDSYVGGIVGKNDGTASTTIKNCINNGVAAGYERYIGGIVGYNGKMGTIEDCASYFSDTDGSVFQMIKDDWKATGDYTGGLAGYNNGTIAFIDPDNDIQVKSIASIVVGEDYVGGVIGFNDIDGKMNVTYKLIGGQIYGYGNAVGGCIGFNASPEILTETLQIQPTSVEGNYHVGGVIGANVVDITADTAMTEIKASNQLASITGKAFTGGVIGYQRTYTAEQLKKELGRTDSDPLLLLSYIDGFNEKNGTNGADETEGEGGMGKAAPGNEDDTSRTDAFGNETAGNLLPLLDMTLKHGTGQDTKKKPLNVPTKVIASENKNVFTIGDRNASGNGTGKQAVYNDISIKSDLYTGGIVGYCERESRLHIVNCSNAGNLSRLSASAEGKGVALGDYLASEEVGLKPDNLKELEKEDKDLELSIGGGIIGANLENQIIDYCTNTGTMNDFVGLGGIVGFNAGGVFNCQLSDNFGNSRLNYIGGIAGLNVHADRDDNSQGGVDKPQGGTGMGNASSYTDVKGKEWKGADFVSGTIAECSTVENKTVSGKGCVGGIVGFNMSGAVMTSNRNNANVVGVSDYVGGMAGANSGRIFLTALISDNSGDNGNNVEKLTEYKITGNSGEGVGGIVGWNKAGGSVEVIAEENDNTDGKIVVIDRNVSISGKERVGGIVGINEGRLSAKDTSTAGRESFLVCQAKIVRAADGYAGGIIGAAERGKEEEEEGKDPAQDSPGSTGTVSDVVIERAINKSERVTADRGPAGGIIAVNREGFLLQNCTNLGSVNSDYGYAGGIAAQNYGSIVLCKVGDAKQDITGITINSRNVDSIGAVCAVNYGQIYNSAPEKSSGNSGDTGTAAADKKETVILSGTANIVGGIAGINATGGEIQTVQMTSEGGTIATDAMVMTYMPGIDISSDGLTVGGVAGQNQSAQSGADAAVIKNMKTQGLTFENFDHYKYLGGIAGENQNGAEVKDCVFANGKIIQNAGTAVGNCYGGVAGSNDGTLQDCRIEGISINVAGIYRATSTSTAKEKEEKSSHIGGIAGKNEKNGVITGCLIAMGKDEKGDNKENSITVGNGMAGGVAGYNKHIITLSGDAVTDALMQKQTGAEGSISAGVADVKTLIENAEKAENAEGKKVIAADPHYVNWSQNGELEKQTYNVTNKLVSEDRSLQLMMSNNGNLGGITAYNAPAGEVSYCATGDWFLNNKSQAIGVGTGGIIGMNESEKNLAFLLNRAFVGRQLNSEDTNRFAGGIIGNQNNTTKEGWEIQNCVNYGTVYCKKTHYSGGILGQWTGTGGNIEKCYNFGNLQTTFAHPKGWVGASGGIVAQLYHAYENNEYNITGCANYGSIYARDGSSFDNCANDSAGILGNVTAYKNTGKDANGQNFTINVTDCVNGAGAKIYSGSMASGIVGFFSTDDTMTDNDKYIVASTANIKLNIERCRNYAEGLHGYWYAAGIFGDRYGIDGAKNTTIKYCFSVSPTKGTYTMSEGSNSKDLSLPIIAVNSYVHSGDADSINFGSGDTPYNFFLSERDKIDSFPTTSFNNSGKDNADKLRRVNSDWIYSVVLNKKRYFVHIDNTENFDIYLTQPTNNTKNQPYYCLSVKGDAVWRDYWEYKGNGNNGRWEIKESKQIGRVLFTIDNQQDANTYSNMSSVIQRGSNFDYFHNFDYYVREFCFTEAKLLMAPERVILSKTDEGKFKLEVDAPAYGNSDGIKYVAQLWKAGEDNPIAVSNMKNVPGSGITVDNVENKFRFTGNTCTFELEPNETTMSGELFVRVWAEKKEGEEIISSVSSTDSNTVTLGSLLPEPKLRIELVPGGSDGYQYRFRMENKQEYEEYKSGHPAYADFTFEANVKLMNDTTPLEFNIFDSQTPYADYDGLKADSLQQLVVSVTAKNDAGVTVASSEEVSIPVYLPRYKPEIPKPDGNVSIKDMVSASADGTNLKDLTITVTFDDSKEKDITTPPIYRAELMGTWQQEKDDDGKPLAQPITHTDYVFQTADILTVGGGQAEAVLTVPEEEAENFANATNIKVRVWYAQSGLGPVYTYYKVGDNEESNTRIEETVSENGIEVTNWVRAYTPVLKDNARGGTFENYTWESGGNLFKWLEAPVLMELQAGQSLKPDSGIEDGHLQYTFTWEKPENAGTYTDTYIVTLTGFIEGENGRLGDPISISTEECNTTTYSVDAENWPYREVEISVTPKKEKGPDGTVYIGKTATRRYPVKKRLPMPEQPTVTNLNVNELKYAVEWSPVEPEISPVNLQSGCSYYEIHIRPVEENAGIEPTVIEVDAKGTKEGYREEVDFEAYAGKRVLVYIKAMTQEDRNAAKEDPVYVHSVDGITYELAVPERIPAPEIDKWEKNWEHPANDPSNPDSPSNYSKSIEEFEKGGENGLTVTLEAKKDENDSSANIPPGGSSYLTRAYVFETAEEAAELRDALVGGQKDPIDVAMEKVVAYYPLLNVDSGAGMESEGSNPYRFNHTLSGLSAEHAGKYILFSARISSGEGKVSSQWVVQENTDSNGRPVIWQLPYVKLPTPDAAAGNGTRKVTVRFTTNPDLGNGGGTSGSGEAGNGGETGGTSGSGEAENGGNTENTENVGNGGNIENTENTENTDNSDNIGNIENQNTETENTDTETESEGAKSADTVRAIGRARAVNAAVCRTTKMEANALAAVRRMGTRAAAGRTVYVMNARMAGPITFRSLAASMDMIAENHADISDKPTDDTDGTSAQPTDSADEKPAESTEGADGADEASGELTESGNETVGANETSGEPAESANGTDSADGAGSANGTDDSADGTDSADGMDSIDGANSAESTDNADGAASKPTRPKENADKSDTHAENSADDEDSADAQPEDEAELYADGEAAQADGIIEEEWTAENTVISWNSVKYADAYYFVLTDSDREVEVKGEDGTVTTEKKEVTAEFKVVETKDETNPSNPAFTVTVYGRPVNADADGSTDGSTDVSAGTEAAGSGAWVEIGKKEWSSEADGTAADAAENTLEVDLSKLAEDKDPTKDMFTTYGKTVKGMYVVDNPTFIQYEAELGTILTVTRQDGTEEENGKDAVFTYTLSLPDSNSLTPPETSEFKNTIVDSDSDELRFTDLVRVWADMNQNDAAVSDNPSEAYVKSEEWTLDFKDGGSAAITSVMKEQQ